MSWPLLCLPARGNRRGGPTRGSAARAMSTMPAVWLRGAHQGRQEAHSMVEQGLKILENLDHRGAVGADKLMGDGGHAGYPDSDDFYRAPWQSKASSCAAPGRGMRRGHDLPAEEGHASRL